MLLLILISWPVWRSRCQLYIYIYIIYYAYQIWQMSISWQWMLEEEFGGILAFFGGNDYLQVKSGWVLGVTKPFFQIMED